MNGDELLIMDTYYHRTPKKITKFFGQYRWLSNFYPSSFELDGITYPTVEHWYQSQKTTNQNLRSKIRNCRKPADAKHLGKQIQIRPDWEKIRDQIMYRGVQAKFEQNPILADRLIDTDPAYLVEGNNWGDTYWGICNGQGQNKLGKILMEIRKELNEHS